MITAKILSGIFYILVVVQLYIRYISSDKLYSLISDYYEKQGYIVKDINDLTMTERIKYGVPLNMFLKLYGSLFTIFTKFGENHFRRIELMDSQNNEITKYIDCFVRNRKLLDCKEFDSYKL